MTRLGFAIATMNVPDILIVDEVLSVGIINSRKKLARMKTILDSGTTLLFVSHSIEQVKRCAIRLYGWKMAK